MLVHQLEPDGRIRKITMLNRLKHFLIILVTIENQRKVP